MRKAPMAAPRERISRFLGRGFCRQTGNHTPRNDRNPEVRGLNNRTGRPQRWIVGTQKDPANLPFFFAKIISTRELP